MSEHSLSGIRPNLDTSDCVNRFISASDLEKSGKIDEAVAVYQEIVELDRDGNYRAIAQKALEQLQQSQKHSVSSTDVSQALRESPKNTKSKSPFRRLFQSFYNLPIGTKQLLVLLTSESISIFGLVGIGAFLIINSGRAHLLEQAESELTVTQINYSLKMEEMGLSFRGKSENPAIVAAANAHASGSFPDPELEKQVKEILQNETKVRQIEYATLVGKDRQIIANANADRKGKIFDPNGLVSKVLKNPEQIQTSQIVPWSELQQEKPPLPQGFSGQDALIRYTVTPVRDEVTSSTIGVLVSGDIVDRKIPIVEKTLQAFKGGYNAIYKRKSDGTFSLATSLKEGDTDKLGQPIPNLPLPKQELLDAAVERVGKTVTDRLNLEGKPCSYVPLPWSPKCYSMAATAIPSVSSEPVAVLVRGVPEQFLDALILDGLRVQGLVLIFALLVDVLFALLLGRSIVIPMKKLQKMAESFSQGKRVERVEVMATDEVGQLTATLNQMANDVVASEANLAEKTRQQEAEAKKQRLEKERVQQEVTKLLLEIEAVQSGDLTVKGEITEGVVGSIADAFNTTIAKLRQLLVQVQSVSNQVSQRAKVGEISMRELCDSAVTQASEISQALGNVAEINDSIKKVANSTVDAANIARQALNKTKEGDATMDETVDSIEKIRTTVADTTKKVKQLAESSQEISQIVNIISGISEKTNLLAFNASVEAARAKEHSEGFRMVVDEVRRLADRVTEATKDIQQLVKTIQKESASLLETIETSTTEVVHGTKLVRRTKQILQDLALTSQTIDQYLQTISSNTNAETKASQQVTQNMEKVAIIAKENSTKAQDMLQVLQVLVDESEELQSSIARFRLQS